MKRKCRKCGKRATLWYARGSVNVRKICVECLVNLFLGIEEDEK